MTRPRAPRLRSEQRRAHLLDVAAAMLLDEGFEALTMEGVARRAGVSKGLGYAYFANAEELALALHDREVAEIYRRIEATTGDADTFPDRVAHAMRVYLDMLDERGALLAVLQTKLSGRRLQRSVRDRVSSFVAFWSRQLAAEFPLSPARARACAAAMLTATDTFGRLAHAGRITRAEAESLGVAFVVGGLRAAVATPKVRAAATRTRRRGARPAESRVDML